jgi:hypothetical protein
LLEVDEPLSVSFDLWAVNEGYGCAQPNGTGICI